MPLLRNFELIETQGIIIDAKSGITGAGRGLKQNTLFSEAGEASSALFGRYPSALAGDRAGDSSVAGGLSRDEGLLSRRTCMPVKPGRSLSTLLRRQLERDASGEDLRSGAVPGVLPGRTLRACREGRAGGGIPESCVGSNYVRDRRRSPTALKNRAIVISVLDNLVKGSAGQAIQNMNSMFGFPETAGLEQIALFP